MAATNIIDKYSVSGLALNRLCMHNIRTRVHCRRMLVWCSLLSLVVITAINVYAVHAKFVMRVSTNTQDFRKYSIRATKYMRVMPSHSSSLN